MRQSTKSVDYTIPKTGASSMRIESYPNEAEQCGRADSAHRSLLRTEFPTQAALFLLYVALILANQWITHAYTQAFGGYSDEPAHFLSSLMIRDYLVSAAGHNPLEFAAEYYVHYPAVAFGMWGPLLHIMGGVWMAVFSGTRVSMLVLIALIAAAYAWSTQLLISRYFDRLRGTLAGLALCLVPFFYIYSTLVMADLLAGLLVLWASYFWHRYLQTERTAMSVGFGVFAALALLTKANPGFLALVPVPAALLAGRSDLLKRRSFWVSIPIVVLAAGPWYVMWNWLMSNVTRTPLTQSIALRYTVETLGVFGYATIPFALAGMASRFKKSGTSAVPPGLWAIATSVVLSFIAYHMVAPAGFDHRYVLIVAPWTLILLLLGAELAGEYVTTRTVWASTVLLLAVVVYGAVSYRVHPKTDLPYPEVVSYLLSEPNQPRRIFLISSESAVETIFVAELALHDQRPNHFVLRASKMLARMNWNGNNYENRLSDETEIRDHLIQWGVSRVVLDTSAPAGAPFPHHRLLGRAVRSDPRWQLARRFGPIEVYEFNGPVKLPATIEVEVPYTLRRTLRASTDK